MEQQKKHTVTEDQEDLIVLVRKQDNTCLALNVKSLHEFADKMTAWDDINQCTITLFKSHDAVKLQFTEICSRIEALSTLINPSEEADHINRIICSNILVEMSNDMNALAMKL